jgi:hypothetical protein
MTPENAVRPCAILKVRSIEGTVRWYADVGFAVRENDGQSFAEVARAGLALQFLAGETPWPGEPALTGNFYVHVDDVVALHEAIQARVDIPWGIEVRPWGVIELTLRDPDGYHVTFTQPDPAKTTAR